MKSKPKVKSRPKNDICDTACEAQWPREQKKSYTQRQINELVEKSRPAQTVYDKMVEAQESLSRINSRVIEVKNELEYILQAQANAERTLSSLAEEVKSQAIAVVR